MPHWSITRRDLVRAGALGAGALLLPLARLGTSIADGNITSPPITPFKMKLPNPVVPDGLAKSTGTTTVNTPGPNSVLLQANTYVLDARVGEAQILPPGDGFRPTQIWGYNGQSPGPTFLIDRKQPIVVTYTNSLTTALTGSQNLALSTHLHGANVDGFSDGHPYNLVQPGAAKRHTYYNDQPAAPLWYHDHAIDHTARNVYHGLAGLYLLSDDNEKSLNLPSNASGDFFDIPLVIQSKFFNPDGSLNFPPGDHPELTPTLGTLGDVNMVNGVAWPYLDVQPRRYRFRMYNMSNAREFLLALTNGLSFVQIGTEGGLQPLPVVQNTIHITPAERYDVVVDFKPAAGKTVVLQNRLESGKLGLVMQFRVASGTASDTSVDLSTNPKLMAPDLVDRFNTLRGVGRAFLAGQTSQVAQVRHFRFERGNGGFQISGKFFDLNRDDANPRPGDIDVWELANDSGGWFHPVHVHLLHAGFGCLVLDRNGVPITAGDPEWSWKETVDVGRNNDSVRVIMQWPPVPVNPNNTQEPTGAGNRLYDFFERRYVFHCHVIDHEDHDMMAQILVAP